MQSFTKSRLRLRQRISSFDVFCRIVALLDVDVQIKSWAWSRIWFLSQSFDNKRGYHSLHWFLLVRLWVIGSNAAGDRRLFWTRLCKTIAIFYNRFLKYIILESYSCTLNKHLAFLKISKLPLEPPKNRTWCLPCPRHCQI